MPSKRVRDKDSDRQTEIKKESKADSKQKNRQGKRKEVTRTLKEKKSGGLYLFCAWQSSDLKTKKANGSIL